MRFPPSSRRHNSGSERNGEREKRGARTKKKGLPLAKREKVKHIAGTKGTAAEF